MTASWRPPRLRAGGPFEATALVLVGAALMIGLPSRANDAGTSVAPTLPAGFQEIVVISGRNQPTAVRFAPNGQVFLTEKSGLVWVYDDAADPAPVRVADLREQVHSFWDRGLLGLAVDPGYPSRPYVYVLYAHDVFPDGTGPRWGQGAPAPSTDDPCPNPPGATDNGCVVFGRLSRLTIDPSTMLGSEQPLLSGNWCQQYPSHSVGDLVFGSDGYLYVSAGDGASFTFADRGQRGDPVNPCGDPPDGSGGPNDGSNAEGGALRSQDVLSPNDPTSYDGTILRVDVETLPVRVPPDNPLVGNGIDDDDFIVAVGLRNPFRINRRPGTDEIWIADVGWATWEEVNRLRDPTASVKNYGWPCYEGGDSGNSELGSYAQLDLCRRLYDGDVPAGIEPVAPHYAYRHSAQVVPGEACGTGDSAITGIAFNDAASYPSRYDRALFFADSSRRCIWTMFADAAGEPDANDRAPLVANAAGRVVDLQMGPDGNLYYVDFDNGRVFRIEFFSDNEPPTAALSASPTSGIGPLVVGFDAGASSDPEDGANLLFFWDLDGDGDFDDATRVDPTFTYSRPGIHVASVRVEDTEGAFDVASASIAVGNSPPTVAITAPSPDTLWAVGDTIPFAGEAVDDQDGVLPASRLSWEILLHHCAGSGDCHTHPITSVSGAAEGSFEAPDHEHQAFVELKLTATDLPPMDWHDAAWSKRASISIDATGLNEEQRDFPVLVKLDAGRAEVGGMLPRGRDLRFTDLAGSLLPHEVESWDPAGDSYVWVRLSHVPAGSAGEPIWMYYGNPAAVDAQDPEAVWRNGYAAVWHLHDDLNDSSGGGNDGVGHGTRSRGGAIGGAQGFDGASWIDAGTSPSLEIAGAITIEAWIAVDDPDQPGAPRVLSKKNAWNDAAGYNLEYKPGGNNVTTVGSGADFIRADGIDLDRSWHHVASVVSGGSGRVYVDGVDRTSDSTLSPLVAGSQALHIGRRSGGGDYFLGGIDEVRVSNVARSAAWMWAQYLSMSDALLAFGPVESLPVLSAEANVILDSRTTEVTVDSVPRGLSVSLGAGTAASPFTATVIVHARQTVSAPASQTLGGVDYSFASWSDGGARIHDFDAPAAPSTLVASYVRAGMPIDLILQDRVLDASIDFEACRSISAGPSVAVSPEASVNFRAGDVVVLKNGFSVSAGGGFTVRIDAPSACSEATSPTDAGPGFGGR